MYINGTGSHRVYKAFGNDVPEEIQQILNMDEVNLQHQRDSYFLLSRSPGEVAAYFNRVARLDKIDAGLRNVQSNIRLLTTSIAKDEERFETLSKELQEYDYLNQFEVELEALEEMEKERDISINSYNNISTILNTLESYDDDIAEMQETQELLVPVNEILMMYSQQEQLRNEGKKILTLMSDIDRLEDGMIVLQRELEDMEQDYHENMPETCPFCGQKIDQSDE